MPFVALYALAVLVATAIAMTVAAPVWSWGLAFVVGANTALLVLLAGSAALADFVAGRKHVTRNSHVRLLTLWAVAGLVTAVVLSVPLQSLFLITAERGWEIGLIGELVTGPWFGLSIVTLSGAYLAALGIRLAMLYRRNRKQFSVASSEGSSSASPS